MTYAVRSSKSPCVRTRAPQKPDCSCEEEYRQRHHIAATKKESEEEIEALEEEKAKVVKGRGKHILQLHWQ